MSAPDPPQPIAHWPIPAAFTPAPPATAQPQPLSYLACLARPSQPLPWGFPDPQRSPRPAPRESDPDPDWGTPLPPPPGRPSGVDSEVDCVLETPPELLPRALPTTVSNAPASGRSANPSCIDGVIGGDRSGWFACFRPAPAQAAAEQSLPRDAATAGLEDDVTTPWIEVRHGRPRPAPAPVAAFTPRAPPPAWIKGLCFHCLKPRHRAVDCRDPVTCRRCFRSGHIARGCTHAPRPHLRPSAPSPALCRAPPPAPARVRLPAPTPVPPQAAMASPSAASSAWAGDHNARPEVFAFIHNTPAMHMEAALLESNGVVAWFDRDRRASTNEVAAVIADEVGALVPDVIVVSHFPERFLVRFIHKHHADIATSRSELPFGDTKLQMRAWRLEAHAEHVDLHHHVRLCLEGLPLYAWDEEAVAKAVGSGCSLDYIEPASKIKSVTDVLALWAWTPCPSRVPRVSWVTFLARNGGAPVYGRKGLEHRVLVHLDIHEDPSSGKVMSRPNPWKSNIVDGETMPRDRRERISRPILRDRQDRRDRDDEGDRGRGRDGRGTSRGGQRWGDRIRWSLSRAPRDAQRDTGRERRDGRQGSRDGRRRGNSGLPAVQGAVPVPLGSGSLCAPPRRVGELEPASDAVGARGRSPVRQQRPASARRISASPPLSPTTVLRTPPASKHDEAHAAAAASQNLSPALIELCSPTMMQRPLLDMSPMRPPGFEASPTPPLQCNGNLQRTPSPTRARLVDAGHDLPAGLAELVVPCLELPATLFCSKQPALLPLTSVQPSEAPMASPRPSPPAARRKTLAGMRISKEGGISLQRIRRPSNRTPAAPVAKVAKSALSVAAWA
uniref:CCHC-type domain-containing protein n=1 Tax=Aegilops tauschii subsp. strangulata TaxID=200361 RepID=A0A453NBB3_AEGTS